MQGKRVHPIFEMVGQQCIQTLMTFYGTHALEFISNSGDFEMRFSRRSAVFMALIDYFEMLENDRLAKALLDGSLNFHVFLTDK